MIVAVVLCMCSTKDCTCGYVLCTVPSISSSLLKTQEKQKCNMVQIRVRLIAFAENCTRAVAVVTTQFVYPYIVKLVILIVVGLLTLLR